MPDPVFDAEADFAVVTGLPGVAFEQSDAYFDSATTYVATPTADTELVELKSTRTGSLRLVSIADLKNLLA